MSVCARVEYGCVTRDIPAPRPPPTHRCPAALPPAAVDTFLKIAQKCRRKFVQLQPNESQAFIEELCTSLPGVIADLEAHRSRPESAFWIVDHVLFPALRQALVPPRRLARDHHVVQIAATEQLYRIFERC